MKVGIVGCGGMGNNFADMATQYDYFISSCINFSQRDLDAATNVKNKLKLSGSEGVGKNRENATALIHEQWEDIVGFISDIYANVEVIAIAFSSSGGSGSGMSPILLDLFTQLMPDKTFVAFVAIPDLSEVTVNQANCLKTFEELSNLNIAVFPIDNQQVKRLYGNVGKNRLFEIANKEALNLFSKIISYTEKFSKIGNFDKKDLMTVLDTKGIAIISESNITDLHTDISTEAISDKISQSWDKTVFAPIETQKVFRAGMIFDGQEDLIKYIDHDSIFNKFTHGNPLDLFEGLYGNENGKLYTILTGLSWCNTRLNEVEKLIKSSEDKLESIMSEQNHFQANTTSIMTKIRKSHDDGKPKKSVKDILSKYI